MIPISEMNKSVIADSLVPLLESKDSSDTVKSNNRKTQPISISYSNLKTAVNSSQLILSHDSNKTISVSKSFSRTSEIDKAF